MPSYNMSPHLVSVCKAVTALKCKSPSRKLDVRGTNWGKTIPDSSVLHNAKQHFALGIKLLAATHLVLLLCFE